jgi:hypothetical protein
MDKIRREREDTAMAAAVRNPGEFISQPLF